MVLKRLVAVIAAYGFMIATAQALPLVWTLENFTFDDGGTAFGQYTYDADTDTYSDIMVVTTTGTAFAGATYTSVTNFSAQAFADFIELAQPNLNGVSNFGLGLTADMTNAGGTITIGNAFNFASFEQVCTNPACSDIVPIRSFVTGSVTATPVSEPASLALLGLGMGIMGLGRRKG